MNNILFRSKNDVEVDNYKILVLLTMFLIFKIFYTGIYPFVNGNGNLYFIFKPIIFYFIYYLILVIFNKKNDNYYIVSSLIISFIIPINTSIYIFIISSIIGNIISYIFNNKINNVIITSLLISLYLSLFNNYIIDNYTGIFCYVYIFLCVFSFVYLYINKLIKTKLLLLSLFGTLIISFVNNSFIFDITLFCLLFVVVDNRYSPVTKYGQIILGILFGFLIFVFRDVFELSYYLFLVILIYEILSFGINYLGVSLYGSKLSKFIFNS